MYKSKKYFYDWDDVEEGEKSAKTMVADILADEEFPTLEELVIGYWGEPYDDSNQVILDGIVEHKEQFSNIKRLFVGDMESDECEVSWILQGNYEKLWNALPNLKELTIKGSEGLALGEIVHENLESLEIICGGLPKTVIESIKNAKLPNLKKLNLYIGIEDYGFDGDIETIKALLKESNFPKLEYLGINDSEIQDDITEAILQSDYMKQITTLDLSNGTLTDKGGQLLLEEIPKYPNIKNLDLHFHYLSDEMMEKLDELPIEVNLDEPEEMEEWDGEIWCYPMLTE